MSNKAMKATHGDVLGHEVEQPRRAGQGRRNLSGQHAMFTHRHGRISYRGTTRHRDTQVAAGHPLAGLWPGGLRGMRRSHRPDVRAYAAQKIQAENLAWIDEMYGADL